MNILIAEDDRLSREMLTRIIAANDAHTVTAAADGEEAWKLLTEGQQRYDIGIFDINMPKIDGFQLLERVRANPSLRYLPAMLCTAAADRTTVARASGLAVSHYLVKPYNKAVILTKLQSMQAEIAKVGLEGRASALERLGMDDETYRLLVNVLLEDMLKWLSAARYTTDLDKFARIAKRTSGLRGASSTFGLSTLTSRLDEIELTLASDSAASDGQQSPLLLSQIMPIFEQLEEEVKRVKRRMDLAKAEG